MSDWTEHELMALRRMIAKAETDPEFTEEDILMLQNVADAFKGLLAFGRFSKWIVFILAAVAGGLTAAEQVTAKVRIWLSG